MDIITQTKRSPNASPVNEKELKIDRVFNLPVEKLWQAWSEESSFKKWWGPKTYTCPSATIDFKVGGKYLACMLSEQGEEFWSTGIFKEITVNKKIVYTDAFSDDTGNVIPASDHNMPGEWPLQLLVTVSFEEDGERTRMKLIHQGVPKEMQKDCIAGWQESFDKLEKEFQ